MAQLVPSILETTKEGFLATYGQETKLPGVTRIQVDFGDGIFVPNTLLPVGEIDVLNPAFHWEAHLMLKEAKDFLDYQICGFKTIIVHYEAYAEVEDLKNAIRSIKSTGAEPAICLKNETPVEVLKQFAGEIKHFQLMSVNPGFQGTLFFENIYRRIAELRKLIPNAIIEVDGGINFSNARQIVAEGADLLILGSALTKAENMLQAFEKIQNELNRK